MNQFYAASLAVNETMPSVPFLLGISIRELTPRWMQEGVIVLSYNVLGFLN